MEFGKERRVSRCGLLEMSVIIENSEVRKIAVTANAFLQVAAPAGWITVDTIKPGITADLVDVIIHRPRLCVEIWIVMSRRHVDACIVRRSFQEFHVVDGRFVWCAGCDVGPLFAIFVLDLVENDVTTVSNRVLGNDFVDVFDVWLPGFCIARVIVAKCAVVSGRDPAREAPSSTFGVDVWSGTIIDVQA